MFLTWNKLFVTMNRLRPVSLFLVVLLYAVCAFSQEPRVPPGFTEDNTENILITTINFDEISFPDDRTDRSPSSRLCVTSTPTGAEIIEFVLRRMKLAISSELKGTA